MRATTGGVRLRTFGMAAALLLLSAGSMCRPVEGQATATATRNLGFDVFGGFSEIKTDYGGDYKTFSPGFAVGADAIRRYRLIDIGIEPRFGRTATQDEDDTQDYFLGNLLFMKDFGRFHPYGFVGIGYGVIHYTYNGGQDNSIVKTIGPGVQVDVTSHWAVKGDFQYQYWNVGTETHGFNPTGITASVVYKLHLGR